MNLHDTLAQKLDGHAVLKSVRLPDYIRIEAPNANGFAVQIWGQQGNWTVGLGDGAWHDEFADGDEALRFISWCYSGEARLREIRRGKHVHKAILEAYDEGDWYVVSTTVYPLTPFWRKSRETIFQNSNLLSD